MPDPRDKPKMNRRQLVRIAAASCVAAAANTIPDISDAQIPPSALTEDTRVTVIEETLGRKLTPEQRKTITTNIKENDKAWRESRAKFTTPDQTEPGIIFRPHREGKHVK